MLELSAKMAGHHACDAALKPCNRVDCFPETMKCNVQPSGSQLAEGCELDADLRTRTGVVSYVNALHQCIAPVGIWHQELGRIVDTDPTLLVYVTAYPTGHFAHSRGYNRKMLHQTAMMLYFGV